MFPLFFFVSSIENCAKNEERERSRFQSINVCLRLDFLRIGTSTEGGFDDWYLEVLL